MYEYRGAGSKNAAIFALEILGITDKKINSRLKRIKTRCALRLKTPRLNYDFNQNSKLDSLNIKVDYLKEAADILANGGLVIMPTETVYGIAANMADAGQ